MPVVMIFHGFMTQGMDPLLYQDFVGQYVMSYDIEAYDGRGDVRFTGDPTEALQFKNREAAMAAWQQISKKRPRRPDGKPNRPLTAMTVEIVEA